MRTEELLQAVHNAGFHDQATADRVRLCVEGRSQTERAGALYRLLDGLGVLGPRKVVGQDGDDFGPAERIEEGVPRWRFPNMMNVRTFATLTVTATTEANARGQVAELVAQGEACAKR